MIKELDKKMDEMQPELFANFKSYTDVDLNEQIDGEVQQIARDSRELEHFVSCYRTWLADHKDLFESRDREYGQLVTLYFKEEKYDFEALLFNTMTKNVLELYPREQSIVLRHLSSAIITRHIQIKAMGRIITLSSNT